MGSVVSFSDDVRLDQAWESYREQAVKLVCNPGLLLDRDFHEELTRRRDRFDRMFLAADRSR
jgi:hypothetical protein